MSTAVILEAEVNPLHEKLKKNEFFKTGYFIAGQWQDASNTYEVTNPATGKW